MVQLCRLIQIASTSRAITQQQVQVVPGIESLAQDQPQSFINESRHAKHLPHCIRAVQRIHKYRHLNAFTFVSSWNSIESQWESFMSQQPDENATESQTGQQQQVLLGRPIAIKDNFCTKGMLTTCGSKMLQNFIPPYTATVVQRLQNAGAIIVGKTNLDEFGMGCATVDTIFGPTKNIWELESYRHKNAAGEPCPYSSFSDWRIPGGSSGGSAVAVASGMCDAALGSDTGGSTRNPASYCGVLGFKPTYGLLSRYGLIPLVNSLDVPGILARSVDVCAQVFNITKGYDENDSTSVNIKLPNAHEFTEAEEATFIKNLRIGIPTEFNCPELSSEVADCWKEISSLFELHGSTVASVSLPHTKYSIACYSVLNPCEVASNMARYDGLRFGHRAKSPKINSTEGLYSQTRHEGFNEVVRGRILAGNYFLLKQNYKKYFVQAMKVRRLISTDFSKVWNNGGGCDVLLAPVTLSAPPKYSDFIRYDNRTQTSIQDYCTQSTNLAGLPAISIPIKLNAEGLPLSLQLIGPKFSDNNLLRIAKFIEKKVQFPHFYTEEKEND